MTSNAANGYDNAAQDFRTGPFGDPAAYVASGEFTRDGKQDLAAGDDFGGVNVLLGKRNGTFAAWKSVATRLTSNGFLVSGDFN